MLDVLGQEGLLLVPRQFFRLIAAGFAKHRSGDSFDDQVTSKRYYVILRRGRDHKPVDATS